MYVIGVCVCVCACGSVRACMRACVCACVYQILASFSSLWAAVSLLCCAHKRIVNIIKVYIERNNMYAS